LDAPIDQLCFRCPAHAPFPVGRCTLYPL
jgi:hypothetical protein